MQWIFRDFQELNPAVYYFCLFIFFLKILSKNLKLHLVKYYKNLTANNVSIIRTTIMLLSNILKCSIIL